MDVQFNISYTRGLPSLFPRACGFWILLERNKKYYIIGGRSFDIKIQCVQIAVFNLSFDNIFVIARVTFYDDEYYYDYLFVLDVQMLLCVVATAVIFILQIRLERQQLARQLGAVKIMCSSRVQ